MSNQPQPALGTNQTQVDPTALNLARAIRQVESGDNPNAKGKSGEYGIGQWMPGNYEAAASKYGLDPNDKSQSAQEHVLYNQVEEQLKAGHTQSQVASWWNSGKYDPTGNVGINKEGVAYDTPAYVSKVQKAYEAQSQGGFVNPTQAMPAQDQKFVQAPTAPTPTTPDTNTPPQEEGLLSKIGHGAVNVLNSIESPFIGAAAIPVQALAGLLGQKDPYAEGLPGLGGSSVNVTPLDLEKKAGDIAQVGSYFVPGSGVLGAAGMGLLQGAGSAMSQGGDVAQTLVGGAEGAALGGAAAGATKLLGAGIGKLGGLISGDAAAKATNEIRDAYSSALNLSAGERAFENRSGKDLAQVLTDNQVALGRYENGTLDASKAIPQLQEKLAPLNQQADQLLAHPQGIVKNISLEEVQKTANAKIDSMTLPEADKSDAKKLLATYLSSEAKRYGTEVAPAQADKIKQGFWAATFDKNRTNLQNHVPYLLGKEMQTATEKAVAGTDTDVSLHALNAQRGDLIDAIRRLQKMDEVKLIKGGRLGNIASGAIGSLAGAVSGLGPLGVLGGDYFGQKAGEFLMNPATKIAIAQYKARAAGKAGGLLGKASKPIGDTISKTGQAVKSGARAVGLLTNLITK